MKKKVFLLLKTICVFFALGIDIIQLFELYKTSNYTFSVCHDILNMGYIGSLLLFIFLLHLFKIFKKKSNYIINILSFLFSMFMIFGNSYMEYGNASLIFGNFIFFIISILMAIGYYLIFRICLCYIFNWLENGKIKELKSKIVILFKKHPFLFSLIILILCWLPYIIAYYPIILSPDPSYQIKQFFGIRTKYAEYAVLLDENVVITNHHPVVHTLLLGSCLKLGRVLINDNFGLFIYSIIQIIILSSTLAYTIKYIVKDLKLSSLVGLVALLIYAFVPMFPLYAMSGVKDVLFTCFIIHYIIILHRIISSGGNGFNFKDYMLMIFVMILVVLFRNNGIYVILLSFPFLILAVKKFWKVFTLLFVIIIGFNYCYNNVLLPAFKITPGSIREMLSIPFQQTARFVKYHSDELSSDDIEAIDVVLGYDDLAERYNPELSDPVKNGFNKYTTNEELTEYFKVWFKCFWKHPGTYINATINNIYGYFYPEKTSWYVYYKYDTRIVSDGFDYHYNGLSKLRSVLSSWAVSFTNIPVIGLISNIAFATWCVFILMGYSIYKKKYKHIVVFLPAFVSILICIASPANTYFRYAMPFIFSMPLMIAFVLKKN